MRRQTKEEVNKIFLYFSIRIVIWLKIAPFCRFGFFVTFLKEAERKGVVSSLFWLCIIHSDTSRDNGTQQ